MIDSELNLNEVLQKAKAVNIPKVYITTGGSDELRKKYVEHNKGKNFTYIRINDLKKFEIERESSAGKEFIRTAQSNQVPTAEH